MASLLSPRRTIAGLSLRANDAGPQQPETPVDTSAGPPLGWPVAAVVGGLVSALAGWVLCAGLAVVGWLAADPGTLGDALGVGTRLWLLSNGVGVSLGGLVVTLVPWGATAVVAYMMAWSAAFAARRIRPGAARRAVHGGRCPAGHLPRPGPRDRRLAGPALARPAALGGRHRGLGLTAFWGASRALGRRFTDGWPDWARALPRAVLGAQLVLLVGGAGLVLARLIRHLDRVTALHAGAGPRSRRAASRCCWSSWPWSRTRWSGPPRTPSAPDLRSAPVRWSRPPPPSCGLLPGLPLLGALPAAGPGSPMLLLLAGLGGAGRRTGGDPCGPVPTGDAVRRQQPGRGAGRGAGRRWCSSRSAGPPVATSGSSG